jgi:hypothetical protein
MVHEAMQVFKGPHRAYPRDHITDGWTCRIKDTVTYRKFDGSRGQCTLMREEGCGSSIARCSREISNYMVAYLLFVNPEMLMAGARRSLLGDAYKELKKMVKDRRLFPHRMEQSPHRRRQLWALAKMIFQKVEGEKGSVQPWFMKLGNLPKSISGFERYPLHLPAEKQIISHPHALDHAPHLLHERPGIVNKA